MARIRKSGGYRKLASFQTATMIYDATVWFCEKFVDSRSRTVDQMVQAARSGRQNIAEGSRAAATSSQTELRLVNVARASLEELLLDYEDFLRHRRLPLWPPNSPEASAVRSVATRFRNGLSDQTDLKDRSNLSDQTDLGDRSYPSDRADLMHPTDPGDRPDLKDLSDQERWALYSHWLDHADASIRANAVICLIHQANYLLDQQIDVLERQFIDEGGYSELLATARLQKRNEQRLQNSQALAADKETPPTNANSSIPPPVCPVCGGLMALRTAKSGRNIGSQFWGCTLYPQCRGTTEV